MGESLKDPVCGKDVRAGETSAVFLGIEYAFCSEQCRDRFLAYPHLYAGLRGQRSPRQGGLQVAKCLRLHLAAPLSANQATRLKASMEALTGILAVAIAGDRIEIVYDLLQVDAGQIETRLVEIGARLGSGWAERLRQGVDLDKEDYPAADGDSRLQAGNGHPR